MFSEVVSQVTALFEDTSTVGILAFEVEFDSLSLRIPDPYSLVPLFGYSVEGLMFTSS